MYVYADVCVEHVDFSPGLGFRNLKPGFLTLNAHRVGDG
jgi:hypothetical protein